MPEDQVKLCKCGCGYPVPDNKPPQTKYRKVKCRIAAQKQRRRKARLRPGPPWWKQCVYCDKTFRAKRWDKFFCSDSCRQAYRRSLCRGGGPRYKREHPLAGDW